MGWHEGFCDMGIWFSAPQKITHGHPLLVIYIWSILPAWSLLLFYYMGLFTLLDVKPLACIVSCIEEYLSYN